MIDLSVLWTQVFPETVRCNVIAKHLESIAHSLEILTSSPAPVDEVRMELDYLFYENDGWSNEDAAEHLCNRFDIRLARQQPT